MTADAKRTIETIYRIESARLIAGLARIVRDVGVAEELAQDALVTALEEWPRSGAPDNPGAWLMATAKNRAIDVVRRRKKIGEKHVAVEHDMRDRQERSAEEVEARADDDIGDDLLRLVFTCCHPVLTPDARVALTLRVLGGLTTDEIARAFLLPEPTLAQRIVRAKKTLADANVPFEVPREKDLGARLESVLEVIYLVFNEGYAATAGDDWTRPGLCEDALRLGRILSALMPHEAEVLGLTALMEIQASRLGARTDATGDPILLLDQNRARWDRLLIARGLAAIDSAEKMEHPRGPYFLQASLAACHARARTAEETDWKKIATLYEELARVAPSPIVELNRAVAVSMAEGPAAGLAIVDALLHEAALARYHLLPSVRGDLLVKLGRMEEARAELERAASMTQNAREKKILLDRAHACESG
ncbi:MAG: RNA polymerase sigma factor [Polyangiaceae bacterium]